MSILDGPMGRLADTLTRQFGRVAYIVRPGTEDYDPATGSTGRRDLPQRVPVTTVIEDYVASEIDSTLILAGDRKALVPGAQLGFTIVPGADRMLLNGEEWEIVRVVGYSSGTREAAFTLQIRR
jgi:hypothetical protein